MTWHKMDEKPAIGRRIVVLWGDGCGPELFFVRADGWVDEEGDFYEDGRIDPDNIAYWTYVPDDIALFCELDDDPVRLEAHLQ